VDEKAQGTQGGSSSAGWNTRTLQTVKTNTITGASLANNRVTLPAGNYFVFASAPSYYTSAPLNSKLIVYNYTNSANLILGANFTAATAQQGMAVAMGYCSLANTKEIQLQHYVSTGVATNGLGLTHNLAGYVETYAQIFTIKI
jgi:hypothetical protein